MHALRLKYPAAKGDETKKLEQQWSDLVAKGQQLLPELRAKAIAAFQAAPNNDLGLSALPRRDTGR